MKVIQRSVLILIIALAIDSCSKTETKSSIADSNGVLLAGAAGSNKSWTITSITQTNSSGTQTATAADIPACELDNVFKFSNTAAQSYTLTEGGSVCTTGDPATIESGNWAFTSDGKSLLIDSYVYITSTEVQSTDHAFLGYLILNEGVPLTVVQLTATALTVTYTFTYNSDNYLITLVLAKV